MSAVATSTAPRTTLHGLRPGMPEFARRLAPALNAYGALFISQRAWVGALILLATLLDPATGSCGLLALVSALLARRLLGLSGYNAAEGLNAIYVGLALGAFLALDARLASLAALGGAVTPLVGAACAPILQRAKEQGRDIPLLGAPFLCAAWTMLAAAKALGLGPRLAYPGAPEALSALLPAPALEFLSLIGALFYVANPLSGLLILIALVAASRVLTLLALGGGALAWSLLSLLGAPTEASLHLLAIFNSALAAMLLGGVLATPSRRAVAVAALGALIAAALSAAFLALLWPVGLAPLSAPFLFTAWLLRAALRADIAQVWARHWLPAPGQAETALATRRLARARGVDPASIALRAPFTEDMEISQGVDGPHTHQGPWRYALDFMRTRSGCSHAGGGAVLGDYFCFDLPVLSPAYGVVAEARDDLPDNPPGAINLRENWGNHLLIHLGAGDYVMLAHLRQGSLTVQVGQSVTPGQPMARCGNSGRSTQPHLHVHVQRGFATGSPTLPFHLAGCLHNGAYLLDCQPAQGDQIMASSASEALASALALPAGRRWNYEIRSAAFAAAGLWQVKVNLGLMGQTCLVSDQQARVYAHLNDALLALFQREGSDPILDAFTLAFGLTPCTVAARRWRDAPLATLAPLTPSQRLRALLRNPLGANLHSRYEREWDDTAQAWRQTGLHDLPALGEPLVFRSVGYIRPNEGYADFALYLGACRTLGSDSENRHGRDRLLTISPGNSQTIAQEIGEKWAGEAGLQPEIPKSDRLPGDAPILEARLTGHGFEGDYGVPGWMQTPNPPTGMA